MCSSSSMHSSSSSSKLEVGARTLHRHLKIRLPRIGGKPKARPVQRPVITSTNCSLEVVLTKIITTTILRRKIKFRRIPLGSLSWCKKIIVTVVATTTTVATVAAAAAAVLPPLCNSSRREARKMEKKLS